MHWDRRRTIFALTSAVIGPALRQARAASGIEANWRAAAFRGRRVYVQGRGPRLVILLHEINGLSPRCIDFGQELADHGFQVHLPLLFGHFAQDNILFGSMESCAFGGFHCFRGASAVSSVSRPVSWVKDFVRGFDRDPNVESIGVIGMCQSGSFPIATMDPHSRVRAVILSQPAIPFGSDKQDDVGLCDAVMQTAKGSKIPMLGFRFADDTICTAERFNFLTDYFGVQQFRCITFDHCACGQTMTHRCHAVLTGTTASVRLEARKTAITFLEQMLV